MRSAVWGLAAAALWVQPFSAGGREGDEPRIHHATAGHAGSLQEQNVMPAEVHVRNPGPRRTAELMLTAPVGFSGQAVQGRRRVELPARAQLLIEIPFLLDRPSGAAVMAIRPVMEISLGDGDRIRWDRYEILGRVYPGGTRAVAVSDARGASYRWTGRELGDDERDADNRFMVRPAQLPRRPVSLSFAEVLILGSLGRHRLDAGQSYTLTEWVASGGLLILAPTPDTRARDLAGLEPILPGVWLGGAEIHTLPIPNADGFASEPDQPFYFAPLLARPGAKIIGDPAAPLALARRHGRGMVLMLSFDAGAEAFQTWPGAPAFWREWIPADAGTPGQRAEPFDAAPDQAQELMRRMAGAEAAPRGLVANYLVMVLAVFGLLLFGSHAVGRAEWGWGGALVFSLASGVGLIWLVRQDAPEAASVVEIAYARASPDGRGARLEGGLGFYSPHDTAVHALLQNDHGYVRPGRVGVRPPPVFPFAWLSGRQGVDGLRMRAGELRHAVGVHFLPDVDVPTGVLHCGDGGVRVRFAFGDGDTPLHGAYVRWRRMAVPLGTLENADWTSPWVRPESHAAGFRFSDRDILSETDELRAALRAIVFPVPAAAGYPWMPRMQDPRTDRRVDVETPAVYGFSHRPVWPLAVDRPPAERRGLVLWRIPLHLDFPDDRMVWPRGVLPRNVRALERTVAEHPDGSVSGLGPARVLFEFALPPESPAMVLESLRLFFNARGEGYRFRAYLTDEEPEGEGVEPTAVMTVPMRGRRMGAGNRIRVQVQVSGVRAAGERLEPWVIEDMEIELAGRGMHRMPPEEMP